MSKGKHKAIKSVPKKKRKKAFKQINSVLPWRKKTMKKITLNVEEKLFLMPESLIEFLVQLNDADISFLFADIFAYVVNGKEPSLSEGLGLTAFNHFRAISDA